MFEQKKTLGGAVKKYNLSIGSHPNCTITLTPGAGKYKAGTVIKVSVTCSTGWQIGQITWNGTAVANNGTFTMPKADVTVACTTSQINYTITKSVPSGGGSITCAATAHYNDTVTYSTTPSADWAFSNCALSGSKTQTGMGASGSFVMPAGNVTLTVNFYQVNFNLNVRFQSIGYEPYYSTWTYNSTHRINGGAQYNIIVPQGKAIAFQRVQYMYDSSEQIYRSCSFDVSGVAPLQNAKGNLTFIMPANAVSVYVHK